MNSVNWRGLEGRLHDIFGDAIISAIGGKSDKILITHGALSRIWAGTVDKARRTYLSGIETVAAGGIFVIRLLPLRIQAARGLTDVQGGSIY